MPKIGAKPRGRSRKTVSQTKFSREKKDLTSGEIARLDAEILRLQQCVKDPYTTQSLSRDELIRLKAERLRDLLERPIRSEAVKNLSSAETQGDIESALERLDPYARSQLPEANFLLRIVGDRNYPKQRPIDFIARSCAGVGWRVRKGSEERDLSLHRSRDICTEQRKHKPWKRCKRCGYSGPQDGHASFHKWMRLQKRLDEIREIEQVLAYLRWILLFAVKLTRAEAKSGAPGVAQRADTPHAHSAAAGAIQNDVLSAGKEP